jgi:zinc finger protein
VTNIEGILSRVKYQIESVKEMEEDEDDKKKAKNLLKKILNITWGKEKQRIIIEDPSGNSAIISDKALKTILKIKTIEK